MADPKVKSANRYVVLMNGKAVGIAQSLDMRDDYSPEPVSGIGDIHAIEFVPSMARHTISVDEMVLVTKSLRELGITAENGDDILNGNVFDIEVQNKDTGETMRKYTGCSYAGGGVQVRKHAIIVSNATFNALNVTGKGA